MTQYFLGIDIGGTKSHALIADSSGRALGFSHQGSGNPRIVGSQGFSKVLHGVVHQALVSAGISKHQLSHIGCGIAGYNWNSEQKSLLTTVQQSLDIPSASVAIANDTLIGLLAGTSAEWGVAIVAGTSCNCRGWDQNRREGRVTGLGFMLGEAAGALELLIKARQAVAFEWSQRGLPTALTQAFMQVTGAPDIERLIEGWATGVYQLRPEMVPIIFQVANEGDPVAKSLIQWAGQELGSMAIGVIRQLGLETLKFDTVLVGSLFRASSLLVQIVDETIHQAAPNARLIQLSVPPVMGGVLLAMKQSGIIASSVRETLLKSTANLLK
ncbi:hypothetical protein H6F51_00450 [Cyanobacteria bacterium FACHB-DQ100]|nr:hypothetical protein [Cyanobacteria bacterium FACHB-DQ100]